MGLPSSEKRLLPSGIKPLPWVARICWHRLVLRDRQNLHCRHSGVYSGMTWSSFFSVVTPGPASTTTPAPSWPRIAGNRPSGSDPERVNSSVWQMPVALISTSTSPAFGPCNCTVSMLRGAPALWATAARTSMAHSSRIRRESERCVNYGTPAAACATSPRNSTGIGRVRQLWNTERLRRRVYIRRAKASNLSAGSSCCPALGWTLNGGGTDDASQSYEAQEDFACRSGRSHSGERLCGARGDRFQGRRVGSFVLGQRERLLDPEQLRQFSRYRQRGACL